MAKIFTQDQSNEMYEIVLEIRDALKDKKENDTKGKLALSTYEIGWFYGIDNFLKKLEHPIDEST